MADLTQILQAVKRGDENSSQRLLPLVYDELRRLGFKVLVGTTDKPHGLREAYLVDADGYVWVPDVHVKM